MLDKFGHHGPRLFQAQRRLGPDGLLLQGAMPAFQCSSLPLLCG
jgi:hypothetical protein